MKESRKRDFDQLKEGLLLEFPTHLKPKSKLSKFYEIE